MTTIKTVILIIYGLISYILVFRLSEIKDVISGEKWEKPLDIRYKN